MHYLDLKAIFLGILLMVPDPSAEFAMFAFSVREGCF